jgi:hypothetical protein
MLGALFSVCSVPRVYTEHELDITELPKSEKPMKVVIRHLPHNTPAEDISNRLVSLGFDVISAKQMTANHRSPTEGSRTINLKSSPFPNNLARDSSSG